jgi:hypothetical protein
MRPEIEPREYRFEVRRTQLTGSTGRLASCGQADQIVARRVIVSFGHAALSLSSSPRLAQMAADGDDNREALAARA